MTIGYWRKANAIHAWFVKNVQDGVDNCEQVPVEREQLEALKADCQKVLDAVEIVDGKVLVSTTYQAGGKITHETKDGPVVAKPDEIAAKIMPTQSGFFFGGTEYDEWYINNLRRTVEIVDKALAMDAEFEFYYRSSW